MSSKVKFWINLVAIVLVFAIITILVGVFFRKDSSFLNVPGTKDLSGDLSMDIEGSVNGEDFFTINFKDGKKEQDVENLEDEDLRFTKEKKVITFNMTFKNLSDSTLYFQMTGIYLDEAKFSVPRFKTEVFVNNGKVDGLSSHNEDLGGIYGLELQAPTNESDPNLEDGSLIEIEIVYTLNLFNRNINNEKQDLWITISKEAI